MSGRIAHHQGVHCERCERSGRRGSQNAHTAARAGCRGERCGRGSDPCALIAPRSAISDERVGRSARREGPGARASPLSSTGRRGGAAAPARGANRGRLLAEDVERSSWSCVRSAPRRRLELASWSGVHAPGPPARRSRSLATAPRLLLDEQGVGGDPDATRCPNARARDRIASERRPAPHRPGARRTASRSAASAGFSRTAPDPSTHSRPDW